MPWWNPFAPSRVSRAAPGGVPAFVREREKITDLSLGADLQRNVPAQVIDAQKRGVLPRLPDDRARDAGGMVTARLSMELPPLPVGLWASVEQIQSALTMHSIGNLTGSGQLALAMLRDPMIFGPLLVRTAGTVSLPMHFRPANDGRDAKEIAEHFEENFTKWFTVQEQIRFEGTLLMLGVSLGQMIFKPLEPGQKEQQPEINCWSIPASRMLWYWDGIRNYGHWLTVSKDGVVEPVPGDGQWVSGCLSLKEPWNQGLINPLSYPYMARMTALLKNGQFMDRMAAAMLILKNAPTLSQEAMRPIISQIENGNPLLALPSGDKGNEMDAHWESVMGEAWKDFNDSRRLYAEEIATSILGQTLTTMSTSVGSHALGKVHESVAQTLIDLDCSRRSVMYREQICKPIVVRNFAKDEPELAPFIEYETERVSTATERADMWSKIAPAIKVLRECTSVDLDAFVQSFDDVTLKKTKRPLQAVPKTGTDE